MLLLCNPIHIFAILNAVVLVAASVPRIPGWTLVWSDDFNGRKGSLPNRGSWIFDKGHKYPRGNDNWGTGEIQQYTASPANIQLSGTGSLWITPIRKGKKWTSARIETRRKDFVAKPGGKLRIQARIKMPAVTRQNGLGYWPAFWTLGGAYRGNNQNWPRIGELDIMENINGLNSVNSGLHCGSTNGGPCNEPNGLVARLGCGRSNCNGNYHLYSVVVDRSVVPETATFYTDGRIHKVITSTEVGALVWSQATHYGHMILLNVAMGGTYPDAIANKTTPTAKTVSGKRMSVDYVAVYRQ